MSSEQNVPLACNLDAIPAAEREGHEAVSRQMLAAVLDKRELPDGYALRLPAEADTIRLAADFIANERLCCPFFRFELVVEPSGGAIWLKLTGIDDVKAFIQQEIVG